MKTASQQLIDHLISNKQFVVVDLYTLSTLNTSWNSGLSVSYSEHYYTSSSYNVAYNGHTYLGSDLIISRGAITQTIGLEVATLDLTVYANDSMLINGKPFLQAARLGFLDGALLTLEKAFIQLGEIENTVIGTVNMFSGRVADVNATRTQADLRINSDTELLNVPFPRNIWQPSCQNTLFDGVCGANVNNYSFTGTVASATANTVTMSGNAAAKASGYFTLGGIIFTNGTLQGTARAVKIHTNNVITVAMPFPSIPTVGDAFVAYAGCDKTMATCQNKFNNLLQFKGCPFVPPPETAY